MAIRTIPEDLLEKLLEGAEFSPTLKEPRRCEHCGMLLAPKLEGGRVYFECLNCAPIKSPE